MSYDDRLIIKHAFEFKGKDRVNTLKLMELDDYIQVYLRNGEAYVSTRIDKNAALQLKDYLENSLKSLK